MRSGMKRVAYAGIFTGIFGAGLATAIGFTPPAETVPAEAVVRDLSALEGVSESCWSFVRSKRIYFAHQSVGSNIIKGTAEILDRLASIGIDVRSYRDPSKRGSGEPSAFAKPGVVHGAAGANGSPEEKIAAFASFLGTKEAEEVDIALLKLCYADVGKTTDVDALFQHYTKAMEALAKRRPTLRIIHCTVPLKAPEVGAKAQVKKLLAKGTESVNALRGRFNDLLRNRYDATNVFDVARAESEHADGTESTVSVSGTRWPALASEYTDDGGHLNELGRFVVAREFLLTLGKQCPPANAATKPAVGAAAAGVGAREEVVSGRN